MHSACIKKSPSQLVQHLFQKLLNTPPPTKVHTNTNTHTLQCLGCRGPGRVWAGQPAATLAFKQTGPSECWIQRGQRGQRWNPPCPKFLLTASSSTHNQEILFVAALASLQTDTVLMRPPTVKILRWF